MKRLLTLCSTALIGAACVSAIGPFTRRAGDSPGLNPWSGNELAPRKGAQVSIPGMTTAKLPGTVGKILSSRMRAGSDAAYTLENGLYGWLTYSTSPDVEGLYGLNRLGLDGTITNIVNIQEGSFTGLWYRDGKWCSYAPVVYNGSVLANGYVEIDGATGEAVTTDLPKTLETAFLLSCYDAANDMVYGYTYAPSGTGLALSKAPGSNPTDIQVVAEVPVSNNCRAIAFNTGKGVIFGVNQASDAFVEIDPATGVQTEVYGAEIQSYYLSGMCYDPDSNSYIFNAQPNESNSYLYQIDAGTYESKLLYTYTDGSSFSALYSYGNVFDINKQAPVQASELKPEFADGALTGNFSFKVPAATVGGTPVLGNVTWVLSIDGKEVRRGSAPAGSDVTLEGLELSEGNHVFSVACSLGKNDGKAATLEAYIGHDTPLAPANVTLEPARITWDAVTEGVHGGYVNPAEVTYTVWLDEEVIAEGIHATEAATKLPADAELKVYTAKVMATYDGKDSEKATSNDITYGEALRLPVDLAPTEEQVPLFTILDANEDGKTFKYASTQAYFGGKRYGFQCNYNGKKDSDDWLWLPAILLPDASQVYTLSLNAIKVNKYEEKYEIKIGNAPTVEAMTQTLVEPTTIPAGALDPSVFPDPTVVNFMVANAGKYYIGIHAISDADQYALFVNDFKVSKSDFGPDSPRDITGLKAVAGDKGALNAVVSFTMPSANTLGTAYDAEKDLKAYITVNDSEDEIEVSGKPGASVSVTVDTKQGENSIKVFPADGDLHGPEASVSVFTGLDVPTIVNNFNITTSSDNMEIIMTWDAPTAGEHGGYVAPTGNEYYLAQVVSGQWEVLGKMGEDVFTYSLTLPADAPQSLYTLGVLAGNQAGMSGTLTGQSISAGQTYSLPMTDDFTDASIDITPLANYVGGEYTLKWGFGDPAEIDPNLENGGKIAFIGYSDVQGTDMKGRISLPRFNTKGINKPALVLDILGMCCYSADIYASAYGVPMQLVQTLDIGHMEAGEKTVTIDLPAEFAGRGWVQIDIVPSVDVNRYYSDAFVLYGYTIKNMESYDFGITSVEGSKLAQYGAESRFTARFSNEGTEANIFPGGKWTLSDAEGGVIAIVDVPAGTEAMPAGESIESPVTFTPTADMGSKLYLDCEINAGDNSAVNDRRTLEISIVKGDALVITDLAAREISYDAVTLEWSPIAAGNGEVQSFEDETPFVLSPEMIGGFKNVDVDGAPTYTFEGGTQIPGAEQPGAFTVWSCDQLKSYLGGATFPAADGDKFLVAFSAAPSSQGGTVPPTDDWLISPAVAGSTLFSFSACPISYSYPETIEVLYSSTDDDIKSFKKLDTVVLKGQSTATQLVWEEFSFQLPADARYVAIRYVSVDMLGIFLDKIAYVPAGNTIDLAGFDIYRDGAPIMLKASCPGNTFTDDTVEANTSYSYNVVPVLADGKVGLNSNTLRLRTTGVEGIASGARAIYAAQGCIMVNGYEGDSLAVISAGGIAVANVASASSSERIPVESGVYVVKAGRDTVKLIVK